MLQVLRNLLISLSMAALLMSHAALAETVVIVHPENTASISEKDIQRIFLGKEKKFSDGKETLPINQVDSSDVRKDFDSAVLGRSTTQVLAYWSKLVFTGKGIPPKEVDNDSAVIEIIENNKNAIGYVEKSAVTGKVKVLNM